MHRIVRLGVALAVLAALVAATAPTAQAAGGATVTAHVQGCPAGFDGLRASQQEFFDTCTTPIGGSVVAVVYGNLAPSGQTDLDGYYTLDQVAAGDVTVYQFPPDQSWAVRAFCTTYTGASGPGDYAEVYLVDNAVTYTLGEGEVLVCQWYNFAPIVAPNTTVRVRAQGCPAGFDGAAASIYDFAYYCQTPLGGFDFAVQYNGLAPAHQTDLDGTWTFTDIPAGYVAIGEYPPDQNMLMRAFCNVYDVNTGEDTGYAEAPLSQGAAGYTLAAYKALDCEWYNFYAVTPSSASALIRVRSCPDGYDLVNATIYDLAADCQGTPGDLGFAITPVNSAALAGQPGSLGYDWNGIPSGKLTIQQNPADGTDIRAFCNQRSVVNGNLGNYELPVAPDGTATDWLFAGYDGYDCDWYVGATQSGDNATPVVIDDGIGDGTDGHATPVAGDPGTDPATTGNGTHGNTGNSGSANAGATSLTIVAFACPSGYDVLAPDANPSTDCTEAAAGIAFTSLGERSGKLATRTTDAQGEATFGKLNSGDHLITGRFDDSSSAFIGACSSNVQDFTSALTPLAFVGPNGAIWIDVQTGEQLNCTWYAVPA